MINLMYCGNDGAFKGMLLSILSILKNTQEQLSIYVLTMDYTEANERFKPLSQRHIEIIKSAILEHNSQNRLIVIDAGKEFKSTMLQSPNIETGYTPFCMLRLFADLYPEIPDKILYLDTDTMSHRDIKELYDIDVSEYEFAGVRDFLGKFFLNAMYMNSGVLLMNMAKIRETGMLKKARNICKKKKMNFPDQTALNFASRKKLYLKNKYNCQKFLHDDTVIQHFSKTLKLGKPKGVNIVNIKPWNVDRVHNELHIYCYDDVYKKYDELLLECRVES